MIYERRSKLLRLKEPEHGRQIHNDLWVVFRKHMKMGGFCPFSRVNLLVTSLAATLPDPTDIMLCDEE